MFKNHWWKRNLRVRPRKLECLLMIERMLSWHLQLQFSQLDSVLPAIILAAQELSHWSWEILVGDTECSSTQGPLHAVAMYYRRKPDLFLGPVCPYVLAPVVRSTILNFLIYLQRLTLMHFHHLHDLSIREYMLWWFYWCFDWGYYWNSPRRVCENK